jgi:predicted Zn-dependent protease
MRHLRWAVAALAVAGAAVFVTGAVPVFAKDSDGVKIGRASYLRKLVPASMLEHSAEKQYVELTRQAFQKGVLLTDSDAQVRRLQRIQQDLLPHSYKFNDRAKDWKWEVNVIDAKTINAFCMPGGKIAFFTGIIKTLDLSDDEIAMVMGHEIAHALREHARERMAKSTIANYGSQIIGGLLFGQTGQYLGQQAGGLLTLKFSRDDETEADLVGMELAARAGYDPRSGITLWEKMSKASTGAPPAWLSTHPSSQSRIKKIQENLPDVMPLYEEAKAKKAG